MHWNTLSSLNELTHLVEDSHHQPYLLFKHSTRCGISSLAKQRLENDWDIPADQLTPYLLDLIANRAISEEIARQFRVPHESPQVLVIKDGQCVYHASHLDITVASLKEDLAV